VQTVATVEDLEEQLAPDGGRYRESDLRREYTTITVCCTSLEEEPVVD
jgi:hypothetical protein